MADVTEALEPLWHNEQYQGPLEICFTADWHRVTHHSFVDWLPREERQPFMDNLIKTIKEAKMPREHYSILRDIGDQVDCETDLTIVLTPDGVVVDLTDGEGEVIETQSITAQDLADMLLGKEEPQPKSIKDQLFDLIKLNEQEEGCETQHSLRDILSDLRHIARENGLNYDSANLVSFEVFEEELKE